jgi:hypothetical protein
MSMPPGKHGVFFPGYWRVFPRKCTPQTVAAQGFPSALKREKRKEKREKDGRSEE